MKKLFLVLAAAFAMVACQTDINEVGVVADGVATVEFEVGTPQLRAYSDGLTVDDLQYAVYEVKGEGENKTLTHLSSLNGAKKLDGLHTNVQIELANNKKYAVIFWADDEKAPYKFEPTVNTVTVTVDYNNAKCNDESRDAFYACKEFEVKGAAKIDVVLKRPFAQVNVGTSDIELAQNSGFNPESSALVVKNACNVLNLVTGEASGGVDVTFKAEAIPTDQEFKVAGYDYLAMSYVLVGKDKGSYDVTYTITAEDTTVINNTIGAVPMQANYRTNIYGKLLTSTTDIDVEIKPGYDGTNTTEAWDGQTIKEPAYDEPTKTYSISCASELAYIAQLVNGTLDTDNVSRAAVAANSLKGCTVKLENNIALNGMEWTPIGNGNKHFMGTFDGNNKTISGLKVTKRGDARAALFGTVSGTVVFRNLTISGAEVRCPDFKGDFYGSALIGTAYGVVTIENVDVVDSYLSGNNKVGALIAHDGVMNTLTVSGCDVSGTTFEALNAEDGGSVGGLLGYFQTGGEHHITNCSVKGCTFNVVNSTNTGKRANGLLFGGIDSKASQKLYIDECVVENNTWNEKFYVDGVEVTEGKFVSPYGGLIGGERDDNAEGELYIDDELFVLKNYVYSAEEFEAALAAGVSVILDTDIDFGSTQLAITGENQVVDLGGHALTTSNNWGGISLKNGAVIKNGTITHTGNTAAIKAFSGSSVENVTINATCTTADKTVTGIAVQQGANVESIKNVTINGVSQGIEVGYQATVGLIEKAVVNESNNGTAKGIGLVINGGKVGKAKDCTFKGETYGITLHLKGVFAAGLELENCKVEGTTASIYAWDEKGISNTSGSLNLTYDAATVLTGPFVWDFEEECQSVVTLNKPQ